ncbi:hypothetical protein CCM_03038 [Cordyceps militaris CM01]|uniref:Folliculin-interacting protein N-terminal domain-containing protein n=1 Tax=Cordyceps militaris (strain CM01) TaxID=983644 RepID=G3J8I0_CORMM|nr:uncharacterized protein CCM_03038 [Cordyceps militaris CM01]EGX94767.1 hypothetical protein CCM_03038 [Cordyceps militaris CM01]
MIGRLLNLGTGSNGAASSHDQAYNGGPRPLLSLDSVQEDIHTRNLLFPDAQALYQHRNDQVFPFSTAPPTPSAASASAYDFNDEIDFDVRDVRILIMQDNLGASSASLLFDSHPVTEVDRTASNNDGRRNPLSPRKGSVSHSRPVSIHTESTQSHFRQGAFDRRGSIHNRNQSQAETDTQRSYREYREELATFSSCIFGNSELMAYKGTSTKVHVVPSDTRTSETASSIGDGRSSIGRSSMRSSKLSQSFSSQAMSPTFGSMPPTASATPRQSDRKKVLITRLFPVNLALEEVEPCATPQNRSTEENTGFPFPPTMDEAAARKKKKQPKQRRTPMYAVVLVVQLPPATSRISSAAPAKSTFREPGSYNEQEVYSSSYNSVRAGGGGWNMFGSGMPTDPNESPFALDVEDRIDSLTQHWDIIMRTLTHLQSLSATRIHQLLKHADTASPGQQTPMVAYQSHSMRTANMNDRRSAEPPRMKPAKSTTKLVSLLPNCLANDIDIALEVGLARSRIVMGIGAARVFTGQGRWGIWRDEAIWTAKWASSLNKGPFFYNVLTGFLATHVDWLSALSSPSHRRKAALQARHKHEEDMSLPARTIIISDDKMAARRLVFLLAGFLPANQQMNAPRLHRASTSTSVGPLSNSPPTFVIPVLREESLRRKINRRTGLRRASHSRVGSQSAKNSTVIPQLAQFGLDRNHQRRASDAASIRTTNLPMAGSDLVTRKSSAATTATITQETTTPHFTSLQRSDSHLRHRPGSSSSFAADDLKRSLKRGESNASVSTTVSRPPSSGLKWGNLMSGFWTARRRDSSDSNTASQTSELRSPVKSTFPKTDTLAEMVQESVVLEETSDLPRAPSPRASVDAAPTMTRQSTSGTNVKQQRASFSQADRTPDPNGVFDSPVKTSINPDDGIIDVDVPFPDYIASFESAISSPSSSGYLSTPGLPGNLDFFEQSAQITIDGDTPLNAAGWLSRFHPDFSLQAIPLQDNLVDKVKAAMRAEPTPAPLSTQHGELDERWVDISSTIMADTTTNTVTRLVYRRLVKTRAGLDLPSSQPVSAHTPSVLPYETQLDEEWVEEVILDADKSLVEAVEKVVSANAEAIKDMVPAAPMRATSNYVSSADVTPDSLSETTELANPSVDVPRVQCKTVMLSALEDIIRDVIDQRYEEGDVPIVTNSRRRPNLLREAVRSWLLNLEIE